MRPALAFLLIVSFASAAQAQSTFVSGAVVGEIARFSFVEADDSVVGLIDTKVDGESVGFSVAVERALGERLGVTLEFVRPGEMSGEDAFELPISIAIFPPLPPVEVTRTFEHKRMAWNTLGWYAQPLGDRLELAFMGGVSFLRTEFTQSQRVTVPALALIDPHLIGGLVPSTTTTEYSVEPIVGMDVRIRLTDALSVVPGIRLQSAPAGGRPGWLVRPSAALRYGF